MNKKKWVPSLQYLFGLEFYHPHKITDTKIRLTITAEFEDAEYYEDVYDTIRDAIETYGKIVKETVEMEVDTKW